MSDVQEICEIIDNIKKQVEENANPDGTCRFNAQYMKWALQTMEAVLKDYIESYKME